MRASVLFIRGISSAVKNLFHAKCVRRQITMKDVVEALMKFYLENPSLVEPYIDEVLKARKKVKE